MFKYMDIPYKLDNVQSGPVTRFKSIWKVEVDCNYKVTNRNGFLEPGLFMTYEGSGVIEIHQKEGTKRHRLGPGSCMLVRSGLPCGYYCPPSNFWKFYFIHLSDMAMVSELQLQPECVHTTAQIGVFVHLCEAVIQSIIQKQIGYMYYADQVLCDILIRLAREREQQGTVNHKAISGVLTWIHQNIDKSIDLEPMIKLSNMSRTKFFHMFKSVTGKTPHDYMMDLKMESAKLALETTGQTVKAVSKSLGFYDEYYFSKMFKKLTGLPPTSYRTLKKRM